MTTTIQLKRGTRANINALASTGGLLQGEPLFITDDNYFGVASSTTAYSNVALSTLQNRPAFHVQAGVATPPGDDVTYSSVVFNIGNNMNTSNGRFTAPVSGLYYFKYNQLAQNAPAGEYRTAIYKNGVGYGGLRYITYKQANTWLSLIVSGHVYLNANEYVTVRYEQGNGNLYTDGNYGSFSGHLIG